MKRDTRDTILRALLADDEDRHELYHRSAVFKAGAEVAVELLDAALVGIAERAREADAAIEAARVATDSLTMRTPYVGNGAEGARRSAQIDREELDAYSPDDPQRTKIEQSAARWDQQAEMLDAFDPPT